MHGKIFTMRALALLMAIFALLFWSLHISTPAMAADEAGIVFAKAGTATADGEAGKRDLERNDPIYVGDTVNTNEDGKVQIVFHDDTVLALGPESEIIIDEFIYDPSAADKSSFFARMNQGMLRLISGKVVQENPERFQLQTPMSVIGIRGTVTGHVVEPGFETHVVMQLGEGHSVIVTCTLEIGADGVVLSRTFMAVDVRDGVTGQIREATQEEIDYLLERTTVVGGGGLPDSPYDWQPGSTGAGGDFSPPIDPDLELEGFGEDLPEPDLGGFIDEHEATEVHINVEFGE